MIITNYFDDIGVVKVTLQGPHHNLLSSNLLSELFQVLNEIELKFPHYGAVIITGSNSFSLGADIKEFQNVNFIQGYEGVSQWFSHRIPNYSIPLIAAVDGFCLGGGFELLLSCDIMLVTERVKLGLPELQLGLIPGFGGTQRLAHKVGKNKAMELILTSQVMTGDELLRMGIANYCYKDDTELQQQALKLATKISSGYRKANKLARILINSINNIEQGSHKEATLFQELFVQDEKDKGIAKFLNKSKL